jgi:hypothetical protein
LASILDAEQLANHQSTATRHDDDSIGSNRWA